MTLNIKHNDKIFLALIAFLVIAFIGAAHSSNVPVQDSDGYYLIGTAAQLRWFRDQVNGGAPDLKAKLTADIDLDGSSANQWTPIGNNNSPFRGEFNGNGHKITGLYINNSSNNQGLFGYIELLSSGTVIIKNLTVSGEIKAGEYIGGICGFARSDVLVAIIRSNIIISISNCVYEGTVRGGRYIGGICGHVENKYGDDANRIATITNCVNKGTVSGTNYVGGICGEACNDGKAYKPYLNIVTISNCVNEGTVSGSDNIGGICGYADNSNESLGSNITISNCVNTGAVSESVESITYGYASEVGGICGRAENGGGATTMLISNCINSGTLIGGDTGGICGTALNGGSDTTILISNCTNNGKLTGSDCRGGICGYAGGSSGIKLTDCGYLGWTAENSIGYSSGSITDNSIVYQGSQLPSAAVMLRRSKTVSAGMEIQPVMDIYPINAYNEDDVRYEVIESSDESVIATHNKKAYAVGAGNATLTVKVTGLLGDSEITSEMEINVTGYIEQYVEGITLNKTECNLHVEDYEQFTATVNPTNAKVGFLKWSSSNPSVATVDSTGRVTAVAEGTAVITAKAIDGSNQSANCMVTVTAAVAARDGDGYYLIGTAAQLKWFRDQVNGGATNLKAKLTADINLAGSSANQWTPIGSSSKKYSGTFDGNGHKITGVYINNSSDYQGLFGYILDAVIKNLTVSGEIKTKNYIGGICADARGATITNCVNKGTVSGGYCVGGICGRADDVTITNCVNEGTVSGSGDPVGGICGYAYGTITNCVNKGTVHGKSGVGGICGEALGTITNCANKGGVCGDNYGGGICGLSEVGNRSTAITNCVNEGTVSGSDPYSKVGGICGGAVTVSASRLLITNCINSGTLIGSYKGGILGYICNNGSYENVKLTVCGYLNGTANRSVGLSNANSITDNSIEYEANQLPSAAVMLSCPMTVPVGMEIQAVIYPVNAYDKNSVRYEVIESSDESIIAMCNKKAYAVDEGKATLTVKVTGLLGGTELTLEKEINVTGHIDVEHYVEEIALNKTGCNLHAGENEQLTATVNPTNATINYLNWTSNNPSVATVDSTGRITAVAEGTAVITAKAIDGSNQSANCTVIVKKAISIVFAQDMPESFAVVEGNTDLSKYVVFSGDASDTGKVVWSSSDTSVASVNEKGIVTWKKTGSVTITATSQEYPSKSVSKTLTVTSERRVSGITIVPETGDNTLLVKAAKQLIANVQPSNAANKDIKWTSSDENIATVDANGLVTAKEITGKSANVTITAEALDGSGVKGTIELTVKRPPVTSMSFGRKSYQVTAGNTKDMYKELVFQPDTALKPAANEITWTSGNVSVDANGLVTMPMTALEIPGFEITGFVMATYRNENGETLKAPTEVSTKAQNISLNLNTKLAGRTSGGKTGSNIENIEVCVYNTANRLLCSGQGTTDENGRLTLEMDGGSVSSGQNVKLWIKGERYLATIQNVMVQLNGNDWNVTMAETIKGGDANGDNSVNLTDFGILGKSFLKKAGVTGYDARADFNADNSVNLTDFGILGTSFLKKGDAKPKAAVTMLMKAVNRNGTTDNALKVLNTETAEIADKALEENANEPEEKQEEAIIEAVEQETGVTLKAEAQTASNETGGNSSSSSGGCNAGFGILALLFAAPLFCRKKK